MVSEFRAEHTFNVLLGSDGIWYPLTIPEYLKCLLAFAYLQSLFV